jgi:hypothetical protein
VKRSCTFRMKQFQSRATSAAAPDASVIQATIDSNASHARGSTWWRYPQYTFCGFLALSHLIANAPRTGEAILASRGYCLRDAERSSSAPSSSENRTGINSLVVTLPFKSFSATTSC